ncbi:MAG: DsrE family protein [Gammaproteobacteria bacterium]
MNRLSYFKLALLLVVHFIIAMSETAFAAPWGSAESVEIDYKPQKVLYDLTTGDKSELSSIFDRLSFLYKLYGSNPFDSSIVVVVHGDAIPFFAIKNYKKHKTLMERAQSLSVGTTIDFRMCEANAKMMNLNPEDIHGFVTMVPMADAELVRLQLEEGYAYLR